MGKGEGARKAAIGFIAGVAGGFLGVLVISWLVDGSKILDAPWWEVMTAIGTIGAAIGAVWIAVSDGAESKRAKKIQSIIYIWKINPFLKELETFFCRVLGELGTDLPHRDKLAAEIENVIHQIEQLSLETLFEFDRSVCINVIKVRNGMKNLLSLHQNAFHDDGIIQFSFGSMLKLVHGAQSAIKHYNGGHCLS
ncbi:MAG: hypothetical protein ACTJH7_00370 [Alcaligenes sp.]